MLYFAVFLCKIGVRPCILSRKLHENERNYPMERGAHPWRPSGSVNKYSLKTEIMTSGQVTMIIIQKKKIVMTSVKQI